MKRRPSVNRHPSRRPMVIRARRVVCSVFHEDRGCALLSALLSSPLLWCADLSESDVVRVLAEASAADVQMILADQAVSRLAHAAARHDTHNTHSSDERTAPLLGLCGWSAAVAASCPHHDRESGPNLRGCALQVAWTPMMEGAVGGGGDRKGTILTGDRGDKELRGCKRLCVSARADPVARFLDSNASSRN